MRLSDLQNKNIVSVTDGRNIGNIIDVKIDEETGEYLFNEEVMVGDAVKICVRAPKNRIEAKAFLNFFATPKDPEGNVITEPSKLAYVVYSKTNMDGVAFGADNGGLKVVDGDPADATEILSKS